ncbi:TPA: hypothetical protein PS529_004327 [Salmonella enterica]|nr:hypothetical protein [Salmonella enterica]
MDKNDNESKLSRNLKFLGGSFVVLALFLLVIRIIIDSIFGGSHLEITNDIVICIGFFLVSLGYFLEKRFLSAIVFAIILIINISSLLGI